MELLKQKNGRQVIVILMVMVMLVSLCMIPEWSAWASTQKTGTITSDGIVETKEEPNPSSQKVNGLEDGKPITILEETKGTDGKTWYQIAYVLKANSTIKKAYVPAEYVAIEEIFTYGTGTIHADDVYVRNEPGTKDTYKLVSLYKGHSVELIDEKKADGAVWYRIRCVSDGITHIGWTHSSYITIKSYDVEEDPNFEEDLRQKGFPESYIEKLSILHAKYPKWVFIPVMTGLEWEDVIAGESKAGINLVQTSANDAKKSVASTEYDWTTNKWTIRDGAGWVTAHPDYIAYRMDPRNYLTESDIFQFESQTYSSVQSLSGVKAIIKDTFMEGKNGIVSYKDGTSINYAEAFMKVAEETNVSPYHLASKVRQEQGKGTSPLISGTYSGYEKIYNYFNIKATGSSKEQIYKNGLGYAKQQGWTTRYASLKGGAQFLAKSYINVGQDTLYFQKFDVISQGGLYWHQYMTNVDAAYSEGQKVASGYKSKQQAFVFHIPVYNNMPKSAVAFTASGNRNNYLKTLSISGLSLTPTFKSNVTEYSIVVENDVNSITVSAKPVADTSSVSGTGTFKLAVGENEIKINCKSQSGDTKTYTITVVREPAPEPEKPPVSNKWKLTSTTYNIGETKITGITPKTEASEFLKGFKTDNCTIRLFNSSGAEKTGTVSTGDKLEVYCNDTLVMTRSIVIYGDVNGDGAVDVLDIIRINRHVLGLSKLKGVYLEAGDANRANDGADVLDIITTNRHTLGLTTINQK